MEQKRYWDEQLQQRLSLLTDKGFDADRISRDTTVKRLRAKIRETGQRLRVIEGKKQKAEEMAAAKAQKLAAPKIKKSDKKKMAGEQPAESKRQQKKRKKKEGQGSE